jgi:hypothetical protein
MKTQFSTATTFDGVQLNMSLKQACYLRQVLRSVGGDPAGPRGLMDDLLSALYPLTSDEARGEIDPNFSIHGSVVMNIEKPEKT